MSRKDAKGVQKKTCLIASALILMSMQSCQEENRAFLRRRWRGADAIREIQCTERLFYTVNVRYCFNLLDP
jgi:hypothetical protein